MGSSLGDLSRTYSDLLRFPLENFSVFNRMRPPTLKETALDVGMGLGGYCDSLSRYVVTLLVDQGFDARVIYFNNNILGIDKTIRVERPIDRKYHAAVVVELGGVSYLLDVGLQFESVIPLRGDASYSFPNKVVSVHSVGDYRYEIGRVDRGTRSVKLELDLSERWTEEDHNRAAVNNFCRDVPLKYGVLDGGRKISLRMNGHLGQISERTREGSRILYEGDMGSCADYLNVDPIVFQNAHRNFVEFRRAQGVLT